MKRRIITILFSMIILASSTGCSKSSISESGEIAIGEVGITEENENNSQTEEEKAEEREAVEQLLKDNGIDTSIMDEATKTETGGTILGDAKPVKQFKTLHDGENYYESYLGLHNTVDSIPDYSLVGLYCINDQFMQAIYESSDEENTFTLKYSVTMGSSELREPYEEREYTEHLQVKEGIQAHLEGDSKESINLILLDYNDSEKHYSIYTSAGFEYETAKELAKELTNNVMAMNDWVYTEDN